MDFKTYVIPVSGGEQLGLVRLGLHTLGYTEVQEKYPHSLPTHITTSSSGVFSVRCFNGDYQGEHLSLFSLGCMVEGLSGD